MLEDSQAKSEEEALEISFGPSHEGLVNWVLSDTATFSYPFTRSIEKEYVTIATSADKCLRIYSWRRKGQHLPLLKRQLPLCGDHGRQSYPKSTAQRKNHPATNARNERVLYARCRLYKANNRGRRHNLLQLSGKAPLKVSDN